MSLDDYRKGARIDPEWPGKILLGDSASFAMVEDLLCQSASWTKADGRC